MNRLSALQSDAMPTAFQDQIDYCQAGQILGF
jgi:hypothetical protein